MTARRYRSSRYRPTRADELAGLLRLIALALALTSAALL